MHRRADLGERRVAFQPEGRKQHLEGHAVLHMGELGAVEVEPDRLLRALARAGDPREAGLAIDEALDQPGAREPVDPGRFARGPHALAIAAVADLAQRALREARLAAAE